MTEHDMLLMVQRQREALIAERDALRLQVAALAEERDALKAEICDMQDACPHTRVYPSTGRCGACGKQVQP